MEPDSMLSGDSGLQLGDLHSLALTLLEEELDH